MLYLILAVISSMLVSVVMRLSEGRSRNRISMLAVNYAMCSALSAAFSGGMQLFSAHEGLSTALFWGSVSGVMYLASFLLLQWNISRNGVVLPATFMKLGVLVPTLMAVTVFGETPRVPQIIGFIVAIAAIVMIQGGGGASARSAWGLLALLLGGGFCDSLAKVYEQVGPAALNDQYLLYTFVVALLLCSALAAYKRQSLALRDVLFGLAIGVPNYFSARFLLLSLGEIQAIVAYPSFSVATIVLVAVVGVACFHERLSRRKLTALGLILVALVLLNI